jgi:hypothetical protein
MFNSPATAILLSGGLVLAGILLVLWFVFLKVGPALSDAGKAEPVKPAPVKGGAGKNGASKAELAKVEAAKIEAAQPRSQRIDLRFDMVVPGTERPGQEGGLILRPTAK